VRQICICCIEAGEEPVCRTCMVRGVIPGWDMLPNCCRGCDYIDELGKCAAFGTISGLKDERCGLRSSSRDITDWAGSGMEASRKSKTANVRGFGE